MTDSTRPGAATCLLVALLFSAVAVVLPFFHAYADNIVNLQLPVARFLPALGAAAAACLLVPSLVMWFSGRRRPHFVLLFLVLSAWAWFMVNFAPGEYGFLDGRDPDWWGQWHAAVLESVFLGAVLAACFAARRHVLANAGFLAALLLFTSLVYVPAIWQDIVRGARTSYVLDRAGVYDFSAAGNIVVFIVDSMQADVVNEILAEDAELAGALPGFTFFRNSVGAFPKTYGAVPSLLSGDVYDNSGKLREWVREAFTQRSLPAHLRKQGYDVRLWPFTTTPYLADPRVADNAAAVGSTATTLQVLKKDAALVANMMLFRLAPHVLKPWVYNDGRFRVNFGSSGGEQYCMLGAEEKRFSAVYPDFDARLADEFMACAKVVDGKRSFRLFHLIGGHAPLYYDERFRYIGPQPIDRENQKRQSQGVLHMISGLLSRLRELGIYDDALILVIGDHGAGEYPLGVNLDQDGLPPRQAAGPEQVVPLKVVQGGTPMILAKPPGAQGPLRISDAPVALTDLPRTVMSLAGHEAGDWPGRSWFEWQEGEPRERLHRYYGFHGWNVDYLVPMTEYSVEGFSWYPESWSPTGRDLDGAAQKHFDGTLLFVAAEDPRLENWSRPLPHGRRVKRGGSALNGIEWPEEGAAVTAVHLPYDATGTGGETIQVTAGDSAVATWTFSEGDGQRRKSALLGPGQVKLARTHGLRLQSSTIPSSVHFIEFRIEPLDRFAYRIGDWIDFSDRGNGDGYTTAGWSQPQPGGAAAVGRESVLVLRPRRLPRGPLHLLADLEVRVPAGAAAQEVRVLVNGRELGGVTVDSSRTLPLEADIPRDLQRPDRLLAISLRFLHPVSGAPDHRTYGATARRLRVSR